MTWLKSNWRWAALNLFALSSLIVVLKWGKMGWSATYTFDPGLESGKWAIRFLLICLAMTPLHAYFGWRSVIKLRKPAGLWAFAFAVLHVRFYFNGTPFSTWLANPQIPLTTFMALGIVGLLIMTALAITSNRWAMCLLGKNWKRLHRLVYFAAIAVVLHSTLATSMSKKMFVRDPQAIRELNIYLALVVVLLVVRIPIVRRVLKRVLSLRRPQRKPAVPVVLISRPTRKQEDWSKVYRGGVRIPLDVPLPETQLEIDTESRHAVQN